MFDFLQFDFNPIYLVWLFVALAAGLTVEAVYLTCFSVASYRSRINRRLMLAKDRTDRESVLVELRRERGLTAGGDYRIGAGRAEPARFCNRVSRSACRGCFIIIGVVARTRLRRHLAVPP